MRYVDTKSNSKELRKCILQGPYVMTEVKILAQPATENTPAVPAHRVPETLKNITPENYAHFDAETKAIHMILSGIGNDIYSIVDACQITHEMWVAIKRIQQRESLNKQDVKTNMFWEFGKFNSKDMESIESYYSRFYKMMKEMVRNQLEVATMQYHNEANKICAEKIAKNANLLALVAVAQHYLEYHNQAPKPHKPNTPSSRPITLYKSHATRWSKGKEVVKPVTSSSMSASKEESDEEQAQRDKWIQKNLALIAKHFKNIYKSTNNNLITSSNTKNKNRNTSPWHRNEN
ncbi:hypothetical protein Tco_0911493 [Tanacetum coccineum]|uniref:Gag-Pol polyprotein n=1 Tax=Tanacetum coccineum TaxID=301880 RepID=A0ABQ5CY48_9ASTR